MRYKIALFPVACVALAFAGITPACSGEGEGQPCNTKAGTNGTDDCQDGLECFAASGGGLGAGLSTSDNVDGVCCPADRQLATTLICSAPTNPVPPDASPPAPMLEASTPSEASTSDAGDGATTPADAPSEAAPTDAPAEGG